MTTTIYEIKFHNGAKYNIFCENRTQNDKMLKTIETLKNHIVETKVILNGIHRYNDFKCLLKYF
ncbi:MAG: hypothetical protein QM532_04160 [Cyanobium sp. MAG06]|nr:hypothetical protein [Cyanobium sp. MAG06]